MKQADSRVLSVAGAECAHLVEREPGAAKLEECATRELRMILFACKHRSQEFGSENSAGFFNDSACALGKKRSNCILMSQSIGQKLENSQCSNMKLTKSIQVPPRVMTGLFGSFLPILSSKSDLRRA